MLPERSLENVIRPEVVDEGDRLVAFDAQHMGKIVEHMIVDRIVQAHFFGTDRRSFITCSLSSMESTTCNDDPGAVFRSYTSFSGAAAENALARIYSGIHFRQDVEVGLVQGRRVADIVIRQVLRPRR